MDGYLTTFDVVRETGIKLEKLRDLINREYIKPSMTENCGRGVKRFFDFWELHCILLFKMIIKNNSISRNLAAEIIDSIRPYHVRRPTSEYRRRERLLIYMKDGFVTPKFYRSDDTLDLDSIKESAFVWNFKAIMEEVEMIMK